MSLEVVFHRYEFMMSLFHVKVVGGREGGKVREQE